MANKRKYRLNIVIDYYSCVNPENYRTPLLELFQNIAWLHKLDFALEVDRRFDSDADSLSQNTHQVITDIVYLRQSEKTNIQSKELRKVIVDLLHNSFLSGFDVDVYFQTQKALFGYPFPGIFYRFATHPYIELHKGSHISQLLPAEYVLPILGDEQLPSLN